MLPENNNVDMKSERANWNKKRYFILMVSFLLICMLLPVAYFLFRPSLETDIREKNLPDLSGDPNYNNTLYILPIWESMHPSHYEEDVLEIADMKNKMGPSGNYTKIGFSVSCWYTSNLVFNESGDETWDFDPTMLNYKLQLAADTDTPILFHCNGGNWGACGMHNDLLQELWENDSNVQWDQYNQIPPVNYTEGCLKDRLFCISPETRFNQYREKFLKQAASIIVAWVETYPELFVGCSLDSEIHLDSNTGENLYYDYNPLVIQGYQRWLASKYSLDEYNSIFEQSAINFTEIDAPRIYDPCGELWELWTSYRHFLVQQGVELQSKWLAESGIAQNKIFAHQILSDSSDENAKYGRCDTMETALNDYGVAGFTRYGLIDPEVFWDINEVAGADWGLFEWNLWNEHVYSLYMTQLKAMYVAGIHVICPNGWIENYNHGLFIKYDIEFTGAVHDFVENVKDYPRTTADFAELSAMEYNQMQVYYMYDYLDKNMWILAIPFGIVVLIEIGFVIKKKHFCAN